MHCRSKFGAEGAPNTSLLRRSTLAVAPLGALALFLSASTLKAPGAPAGNKVFILPGAAN